MSKKYLSLLITIILLTIYFLLYYLITGNLFPCIINKYTGYYCPTCGFTRMIISLINLDFYQAFRYNCFFFILLMLLPFIILFELLMRNNKKLLKKINYAMLVLFMLSLILFGIVRNLSGFEYYIPTIVK